MKNRKEWQEKVKEVAKGMILVLTLIALLVMAIAGALYAATNDNEQGTIFYISAIILMAGVIIFSNYHGHGKNNK